MRNGWYLIHQIVVDRKSGVAESGDDFTKFSTISQWFQTLINPALMQRGNFHQARVTNFDV
ncbi:O-methyltransferase family protein [C1] [Richelia intracellularis]|nr:O-methyltransferase family protein [C1] [Richelia intracellularis]